MLATGMVTQIALLLVSQFPVVAVSISPHSTRAWGMHAIKAAWLFSRASLFST